MTSTLADVLPVHPITGMTALGFTLDNEPVWPVFGGDENDDDTDDDETDDDDEEDDEEDDPNIDWKKRAKEAEKRAKTANFEAGARRKLLKKHGIDPRTGEKRVSELDSEDEDDDDDTTSKTKKDGEGLTQKDVRKAVAVATKKAVAEAKLELQPILHALASRVALDDSGVLPEFRDLVADKLDMEDLDVDDEGNIMGLDEQLSELKRKYPRCFIKKGARGTSRGTGGASELDGGEKKGKNQKSLDDQMEEMMTGRR